MSEGDIMKLVLVEAHGNGFYHEVHKDGCKDLGKKAEHVFGYVLFGSVKDVRDFYEAKNAQFEDGGYVFDEHCKVFPCVKG
jgi:hypothetical protein